MADLSKFKRKGGLGAPPPISEASGNLDAPEVAPAPSAPPPPPEEAIPPRLSPLPQPAPAKRAGEPTRDGRSARRTGRTVQFATRVSDDFDSRFRAITVRDDLLMVELLELSLEAYEGRKKAER